MHAQVRVHVQVVYRALQWHFTHINIVSISFAIVIAYEQEEHERIRYVVCQHDARELWAIHVVYANAVAPIVYVENAWIHKSIHKSVWFFRAGNATQGKPANLLLLVSASDSAGRLCAPLPSCQ